MYTSVPSAVGTLDYVGSSPVPYINFKGVAAYKKYVDKTPDQNFVAMFYGTLK
jgi:hypothetical protein